MIELGRTVRPQVLNAAIRRQSYWLDLGRALAHSGKQDREALVAFVNAERSAPIPFVLNPLARDAVVAMVHRARRRSVSDDLWVLARRIGVHVAAYRERYRASMRLWRLRRRTERTEAEAILAAAQADDQAAARQRLLDEAARHGWKGPTQINERPLLTLG